MQGFANTNLPPELRVLKEQIEAHARAYGLDFYETIFEVIDAEDLNEIAAYGGLPPPHPHPPVRAPFEQPTKDYDCGASERDAVASKHHPSSADPTRREHKSHT